MNPHVVYSNPDIIIIIIHCVSVVSYLQFYTYISTRFVGYLRFYTHISTRFVSYLRFYTHIMCVLRAGVTKRIYTTTTTPCNHP